MANSAKVATVAELTQQFRDSSAVVLTDYRGLSVSQLSELRTSLGEHATYTVAKNTLTTLAARAAGVEALEEHLVGPSALAFVTGDVVAAAKGLRAFARDNSALVIKGGYMDGRALSASDVGKLADLESREVVLAKLAGAMKASLSGAAGLFNAPMAQTARTIEALRAKRDQESAS